MSAALREKVMDPNVRVMAAAHAVTDSVLNAASRQMTACGFDDGFELGEDRALRRLIWLAVLRRIDRKRDPMKAVVSMAVARAPEPTRASALVASGLIDVAVGAEDLARRLARSVADELQGMISEVAVCSAIRRGIVDLLNAQAHGDPGS